MWEHTEHDLLLPATCCNWHDIAGVTGVSGVAGVTGGLAFVLAGPLGSFSLSGAFASHGSAT